MSSGANSVIVGARYERTSTTDSSELSDSTRRWIRLVTFAALALYGAVRWGTLMSPAPTGRLLGLAVLAVMLVAAVPPLRRYGLLPALALTVALCLLAFPIAGLQWHSFIHLRVAVSARHIADGLGALPTALVPYVGISTAVRLVIVLGAAILLLDAAIVIAFAPPDFGDGRRAGAALPLIALAVVPATLVRPQFPYLQGLLLFALLAAFMWGERVRRDSASTALVLAMLAGIAAALIAPRLDQHKPLLNYRAWTGSIASAHIDSFNWNQTYGPLRWPHSGHEVLTVDAKTADYWKAEDLDMFNGYAWVLGTPGEPSLPPVSPAALAAWSHPIRVTIEGMRTTDVIAPGEVLGRPAQVPGGAVPGVDPGRWTSERMLKSGSSYQVTTYSPHPSASQLQKVGSAYPYPALNNYITLTIPEKGTPPPEFTQVTFGPFHAAVAGQATVSGSNIAKLMADSPYASAYTLAQDLAAHSRTPYAFVTSVLHFLSRAHGYSYNQKPPVSRYPLVNFLFKDKAGYCQQFSGAMALLLRMGGLPARVAAGFTSGTRNATRKQWQVSDIDAHAWVEVWFPHYGWVRFDPTPAVAPARGGATSTSIIKPLPGSGGARPGSPTRQSQAASQTSNHARHSSGGGLSPVLIVPALAVLALLALLVRDLLRRHETTDTLLDELERAMARTGRPLGAGVTLARLEHRFRDSPAAAGYIRALRLERYGGVRERPSRRGRRALREQLRRDLGWTGRLRALWALPPHTPSGLARRGEP